VNIVTVWRNIHIVCVLHEKNLRLDVDVASSADELCICFVVIYTVVDMSWMLVMLGLTWSCS